MAIAPRSLPPEAFGIGQIRTEDDLAAFIRQELDNSSLAARIATAGSQVRRVNGSPEGAVKGPRGTVALRADGGPGTTLYVKEQDDVGGDPTLGWAAK